MNSVAFTPEEVERGMLKELLDFLIEQNTKFEHSYNEIHICSDGVCQIVEWDKVPYSHEYGGTFQYVDEDHLVVKEFNMPDGCYEWAVDDDMEKEIIDDYLKEHPEYYKDVFGRWRNKEEDEAYKKLVLGEDKKEEEDNA